MWTLYLTTGRFSEASLDDDLMIFSHWVLKCKMKDMLNDFLEDILKYYVFVCILLTVSEKKVTSNEWFSFRKIWLDKFSS